MTLVAGTRIGKYVVQRKIAEGGMAEIYLCSSSGPGGFEKDVVIKRIRSQLGSDPEFVAMFITEARVASRLNHPNVVQIFDFAKHEDTHYLAMEYVQGHSLWEVRRRAKEKFEKMPPTLVAHLGAEVARGLHYAHRLTDKGVPVGLVHRDVSPHNILLSLDGAVKLTDFGIARAGARSTVPGVLKGKLAYMAPEQARGEDVDARSDVFALGIVLWELLTGGRLFDAETDLAILRAVQERVIAPPARLNPDVPPALDAWVMKALSRDAAARPQTAQELERGLSEFVFAHVRSVDDRDVGAFLRRLYGDIVPPPEVAPEPSDTVPPVARDAPAKEPGPGTVGHRADEDPHAATLLLQRSALAEGSGSGGGTAILPGRPSPEKRELPDDMPVPVRSSLPRPTVGMRRAVFATAVLATGLILAAIVIRMAPRSGSTSELTLPVSAQDAGTFAAQPTSPPDAGVAPVPLAAKPVEVHEVDAGAPEVRRTGVLKLHVMPWANVYVAGRRYEASPAQSVRLPEGSHKVRIENPELHWSEKRVVVIRADRESVLQIAIPIPGKP